MILEVGQQLEHYDALFLKIALDPRKLDLELRTHDRLLIHWLQKFAVQLGKWEDVLQCLEDMGKVQEALVCDIREISIMQ